MAGPPKHSKPSASRSIRVSTIRDVALRDGSVLVGTCMQPDAKRLSGTPVTLMQNGKPIVALKCNREGRFAVLGIRPGVYEVRTHNAVDLVRIWAPSTAPPSAATELLMVVEQQVVRGQENVDVANTLERAAVVGAGVAAAGGGLYWALDYNKTGS